MEEYKTISIHTTSRKEAINYKVELTFCKLMRFCWKTDSLIKNLITMIINKKRADVYKEGLSGW